MSQVKPLQFAYWVPNVSGGLVISQIEQRTRWDAEYNRELAKIAERAGFDYALTQIRFTAGYGADNPQYRRYIYWYWLQAIKWDSAALYNYVTRPVPRRHRPGQLK